jgi:hypothetical protein
LIPESGLSSLKPAYFPARILGHGASLLIDLFAIHKAVGSKLCLLR